VWVQDDPRFLYLSFETGQEVNAQLARGTLRIVLDSDGVRATGREVDGLEGTDLAIELSHRATPAVLGTGMRVFVVGGGDAGEDPSAFDGYSLDLMAAPTHSADRFEVRIGRGRALAANTPAGLIGDSVRIGLSFEDADGVRDRTEIVSHPFATRAVFGPRLLDNRFVHPAQGSTRVVQWNVSSENFYRQADAFARVLGGLDAHVIVLDELPGSITWTDLERFLARPEFSAGAPWQFTLGRSGGRQKTAIVSRLKLRAEEALLEVDYPSDSLDALAQAFPDSAWMAYLEREAEVGLSVAGAWVDIGNRPVLIAGVDLQSRGHDGSPQDRLRDVQASVLLQRLNEASGGVDGAALIVAGDLNTVGSARSLERLLAGSPRSGRLIAAPAYTLNDASNATWRSPQGAPEFTPGRLDYVLVSESAFTIERTFVFDAGALTEARRSLMEVAPEANDNQVTSDHLPVVVDLILRDAEP